METSRNEPCPCGSGKKYKRCHGVDAAPKLGTPKAAFPGMGGDLPPALQGEASNIMNNMDPAVMAQFTQALQRLPRGQMQRLQAIMQRAMSGQDVSRDAAEFERTLPMDLQEMLRAFQMPGMPAAAAAPAEPEMSVDAARAIVEKAVAEGKVSKEQAESLLQGQATTGSAPAGFSKLWKGFGKK